ncbi:hypothetical protein ES702_02549 [subsurface metagenome]
MGTTSLFIEFLLAGAVFCVSLIFLILWKSGTTIEQVMLQVGPKLQPYQLMIPFMVVPIVGVVYAIGAVFNAVTQWILKAIFFWVRKKTYRNENDFFRDKSILFVYGSSAATAEYVRDKHTVVIIRCLTFNLPLVVIAITLYYKVFSIWVVLVLIIPFAICLYTYGRKYGALMKRLKRLVEMISKKEGLGSRTSLPRDP